MAKLDMIGALAVALSLAAPVARSETYTLETYYPSPVGVYTNVRASQYRFLAYQTRSSMDVLPMPAPGTFVYCAETDRYYASSSRAISSDPSTWWFRIILDDTAENIYAQGAMDFPQPNNSYAWAKSLGVTTGKLYNYNDFIRSNIKINQAGSYTAASTGRVCEVLSNGGSGFVGPSAGTVFRLRLRFNGTYVGDQTSFSLGVAPDQENDCYFDPGDTLVVPASEGAVCYCAPYSVSGAMNLAVGNQPYVGLLSYGAKSASVPLWNATRNFGGFIVHVDDIKIYK
jgi:hypothetical protein